MNQANNLDREVYYQNDQQYQNEQDIIDANDWKSCLKIGIFILRSGQVLNLNTINSFANTNAKFNTLATFIGHYVLSNYSYNLN